LEHFIRYKDSKIQYWKYGTGPVPLVCLHGFEQDGSRFAFLERAMGKRFTMYAISLPFHGHTQWKEGLVFLPEDLYAIIQSMIPQQGGGITPIHLLGYSIGGRLALAFFERYPAFVKAIYLAAPDGLHANPWYWFATQTALGNRLFQRTMHKPAWLIAVSKGLVKRKMLDASLGKFAEYYLGNEDVRMQLYQRWISFRKFVPHLNIIKKLLVIHQVKMHILFGKQDGIIRYQTGEKFQRGHEDSIRIILLETGHHLMHERYLPNWKDLLDG